MTDTSRHSIKVPRLFKEACKIAKLVREEGESLKELVYSGKHPNIKAVYALVVQTLQHEKELETIFEKSKILEKEKGLDPWLARVLITELIWGKKRLSGECKPVKTVLSYKSSYTIDSGGDVDAGNKLKEVNQVRLPRYARVNTLYLTVEETVDYFRNEGWLLARQGDETLFPSSDHFRIDVHIPDVLVFPPGTELYHHPLYKDRTILLQDKASCLAAHLLAPPPGSTVLDMCAAPGMKTTHLAARMHNKGMLYAVEKSPKRYKTLCSFIEESGATCVKSLLEDSVQLKAEKVPNVEYILVDPSCSGTGMVTRPCVGDSLDGSERLRKLVGFQRLLLLHALTEFPKAKRVVYSTCSLLPDENEGVVRWALEEVAKVNHASDWCLTEDPLPGWTNRGCEMSYPGIGKHCLYSRTETDQTNGFFLTIFERAGPLNSQELAGHQLVGIGRKVGGLRKEEEGQDTEDAMVTVKNKKKRKEDKGKSNGELTVTSSTKTKRKGAVENGKENDMGTKFTARCKKKKGTEAEGENYIAGATISTNSEKSSNKMEKDSVGDTVMASTKKKRKGKEEKRRGDEGKDNEEPTINTKSKKKKHGTEMEGEYDHVETTIAEKSEKMRYETEVKVDDAGAIITGETQKMRNRAEEDAVEATNIMEITKKRKGKEGKDLGGASMSSKNKRKRKKEEEEVGESDVGAAITESTKEGRKEGDDHGGGTESVKKNKRKEMEEDNGGGSLTVKSKKKKKKKVEGNGE